MSLTTDPTNILTILDSIKRGMGQGTCGGVFIVTIDNQGNPDGKLSAAQLGLSDKLYTAVGHALAEAEGKIQ